MLAIARGAWKTLVMRGKPERQLAMLMSLSPEDLIPSEHPIRKIRRMVDAALAELVSVTVQNSALLPVQKCAVLSAEFRCLAR